MEVWEEQEESVRRGELVMEEFTLSRRRWKVADDEGWDFTVESGGKRATQRVSDWILEQAISPQTIMLHVFRTLMYQIGDKV